MADEVLDLIRGGAEPEAPAYPSRSMATSAGRKKTKKPEEEDEVLNLIQGNTSTAAPNVQAGQQPPSKVRSIIGNVLQKGFEAKQAVPAFTAAVLDVPASLPQFITSTAAYPITRAIGGTPEQAKELATSVASPLEYLKPGKFTGLEETGAYQQSLPAKTMEFIGENIHKGVNWIAEKTGLNPNDVQAAVDVGMLAGPKVVPKVIETAAKTAENIKAKLPTVTIERQAPTPTAGGQTGMQSGGAAATPNTTMIQQAMSVATPELQQALKDIPVDKINVPTFQRHIEADTLPVPVRLTEGQATGDVVKLSQEQNRRGKDPQLAERFNQQNKDLIDNVQEIRNQASPDVYGTKTIENSQGIIDAYKEMDAARNTKISDAYKKLEDANGGQFPVDGKAIATNADALLAKKLKTEFLPSSIKNQLDRFKNGEQMTFEQYEALRTNLAAEIRKAEKSSDGNAKTALSLVRQAAEQLPLQQGVAGNLKGLADNARSLAKERFDMLKKDPAYNAAVNDIVPADNFIQKFVINGVNKNVQTMVNHLGKDSPARQHMAAGTINWLADKAGIYGEQANFSQAGFNKGLKQLDAVKNTQEIFDPATATHLRTLGNVAGYTQFQPRGSFVNNSNTLVGSLAEKGKQAIAVGVEKGGNLLVPGLQLGTTVMEMRARRAAEAETRKALELGAGTKQSGKNQINNLNNP
jgi:hypothetical protein